MSLLVCGFFWSANSTSQAQDFHYPNLREFRMEFRYHRNGHRTASVRYNVQLDSNFAFILRACSKRT
jgi:hypothetical protein